MAHATGFCAEIWRPIAERLADSFDCWALDFRGHGRSGVPASGSFDWDGTADDVFSVIGEARRSAGVSGPWFGVGHSMGGAALLLAEQRVPGTFRGQWAFEPVVFPPGTFAEGDSNPLAESAARRRAGFESRDAARANYSSKPPMNSFDPDALEAYLDGGLIEADDGTVRLACEPQNESSVYQMASQHGAFEHLGEVQCPVVIARGVIAPGPGAFADQIAERLPHGRLEVHETLDHFGPMVDPGTIAASIRAAASG